jgi:NADH-quinone oxidoreductase subunit N
VPFHLWSPDVYEGSPSPIAGFMAAVAKAGAFAALLRVFVTSFPTLRADWQPVVWMLALLSLVLGAVVALTQRDVKRMMAYSSINHVGFILLGVEAASARGVSASLYYLFTYTFLVIGSFAVISVVAGPGDTRSKITDYRGLAKRQPVLALAFAVLLLGQAGAPFTTGFLAKLGVIEASVAGQGYGLAVVAMASAAVAAFFYLRLAVTMFSPVGDDGDALGGDGAGAAHGDGMGASAGDGVPAPSDLPASGAGDQVADLQILTDAPPSAEVAARGVLPVPPLTAVAVGLCVAFTVVFGIVPEPILNFAHRATLLLLG